MIKNRCRCSCRDDWDRDDCKVNCELVYEKIHCLFKKAQELYAKANSAIDKCAICSIKEAICAIKRAFELANKGDCFEDAAYKLLKESGCDDGCNINSRKCRELAKKAEEEFCKQEKKLNEALNLLEQALDAVEASQKFREKGIKYNNLYLECIHNKDCDPCDPCDPCDSWDHC